MNASDDLFVSETHPVSRRSAVIEDDGRVAWLYLSEPDSSRPAADCWLYNRVPTPPRFEGVRGAPPVVPLTHTSKDATIPPPTEDSVQLQWTDDGESVAVFFGRVLMGFTAQGQKLGFSKLLRVNGPFGNILDTDLFKKVFDPNGLKH